MNSLVEMLTAAAVGAGSAFVPILNAEAYALVRIADQPWLAVPIVLALAAGQTLGKMLLFEAARRSTGRLMPKKAAAARLSRWTARVQRLLTNKKTAGPAVLASAVLGIPPLAAVSVAAGAAGQSRRFFAALCLTGRAARFGLLALPAFYASQSLF
jgi:membrane protein YqaA with SNARE-associated domain